MLIIKRPLHKRKLQLLTSFQSYELWHQSLSSKLTTINIPEEGLWRLLERRVLHPRHMQWLRKLGLPGKCMRSCAYLCVGTYEAGSEKASLYSSSSKRSHWSSKGSAWPLQCTAVWGGSLLLSFSAWALAAFPWNWVNDGINYLGSPFELQPDHHTSLVWWWSLFCPLSSYTVNKLNYLCLTIHHETKEDENYREREGRTWKLALEAPDPGKLPLW